MILPDWIRIRVDHRGERNFTPESLFHRNKSDCLPISHGLRLSEKKIMSTFSNYKLIQGHLYGLKYPSIMVNFLHEGIDSKKQHVLLLIHQEIRSSISNTIISNNPPSDWIDQIIWMSNIIRDAMQASVFQQPLILNDDNKCRYIIFPCQSLSQSRIINHLKICDEFTQAVPGNILTEEILRNSLSHLSQNLYNTSNTRHFLRAAHECQHPYIHLTGETFQYGHGHRQKRLQSSFTSSTSLLGTVFARNKVTTAELLQKAGIPTAQGGLVNNAEEACKLAEHLGYPVVLKPVDLDGGVGVWTHLTNNEQIENAFSEVKKFTQNVLLEKHHEGRDFRIIIYKSKFLWAIERRPAGVVGDGISSIERLVALTNQTQHRSQKRSDPLMQLTLDEEAFLQLDRQNLHINSIPVAGEYIRLRGKANIASGGTPVPIKKSDIHSDNINLAIRATEIIGLDLAGIDLIIPDIGESWLKSGALLCEVNAQPNLGQITSSHLYSEILSRELNDKSRIPITIILGQVGNEFWLKLSGDDVYDATGIYRNGLSRIGEEILSPKYSSPYVGGIILILHSSVQRIIMEIVDYQALLREGFPFDEFDDLIISEDYNSAKNVKNPEFSRLALDHALLHCQNRVTYFDVKLSTQLEKWQSLQSNRILNMEIL